MFITRRTLVAAAACISLATLGGLAQAQATLKIGGLYELSGAGASAGTNFKNGGDMAVKEINAAGGILGKKLEHSISDTQSNPGVAKGLATKAIDDGSFAVFGSVFSGSIMGSMAETRRAEVPNFTGGEAAAITKALADLGVKFAADISTDSGQVDFSAPVLKAKQANADAIFVYTNEEESARALRELRKQGVAKPIVGETTLTGQKVIELAGNAANGAIAHVGLSVSAAKLPGIIMDVGVDNNGDLDRESFMVEVKDG